MRALLLPLLLLLLACHSEPRYQLIETRDGLYRLDKETGEVWLISGTDSYEVLDPAATLERKERLAKDPLRWLRD